MEKKRAPVYEALLDYRAEKNLMLHMPGHNGGRGFTAGELAAIGTLDFTEVPGLDDLHNSTGPLRESRELLARAFGAGESFFLVNGATSGIQALFLAACSEGDTVLLPRNGHRSFFAGLLLSGAFPVYYPCQVAEPWGIAVAPRQEVLASCLKAHPEVAAVFVVSPTYYGTAAGIKEIVCTAAKYDKMVLVDEAHGPHFGFHPRWPMTALRQGSAAVVHGMHKVLPVLTQGGVLHIATSFGPKVRLRQAYDLLTTTSPSYPLVASLDLARCLLEEQGFELLERALGRAEKYRAQIKEIKGLDCPGEEFLQFSGVKGYDPLKVLISTRQLAITGYQLAAWLRQRYHIQVELAQRDFILAMFSLYHGEEDWQYFYQALKNISQEYPAGNRITRPPIPVPPQPEVRLTPRKAYFSSPRRVKIEESAGKIAAEMVTGYPPGIPCLLPGELITPEVLDYLIFLRASGSGIQGPEDTSLSYIYIID